MRRDRGYVLLTVALVSIGLSVRALPLLTSSLPTPHAFGYIPPTMQTVETGQLVMSGRTDHFFWYTFLAENSLILGVSPLALVRPLSALLGALPVILAIAVTRRLCADWGWSPHRTWTAAALAGLFIGIQGLYLYRSMAPHPNTIGLFVLPLFVITLYRAYTSERLSWWIATAALLVILPPLHVFVSLTAAIMVTILAGIVVVRTRTYRKTLPVIGVASLLWIYVPGFHLLLRALTPTRIAYTERVTEVPGLYIAWIILGVFGTVWFMGTRPRRQRILGWAVFGLLFGLLALNAITPLFHQAPQTPPIMLAAFLPLLVPVTLAIWRVPDATQAERVGPALVAMVAGTVVIIAITLTSLPTVAHLTTAERANYFMHFPLMVLAGLGGAALLANIERPNAQSVRAVAAVAILMCAAVSIPVALAGVPVLPYENSVTGAELSGTVFGMEHANDNWTSDKQITDVASRIGPDPASPDYALVGAGATNPSWQPTHQWMQSPDRGPPPCTILTKGSWNEGAMFYPQPVERLDRSDYEQTIMETGTVYHTEADDPIRLTVPVDGETGGC